MAVVQSNYVENIRPAVAGMVANMTNADGDTRIVETAGGIPFGVAVGQGAAARGAVLGAAAATGFVGVSIRDVTLQSNPVDRYELNDSIAVLTEGDIWVLTGGAVAAGADVTFDSVTGVLSSAAASGTQFVIAGARWMSATGGAALAVLRLGGALPAA